VAVLVLLTPIAGGAALGAALVGETGRVEVTPVLEQALDQTKAEYRRPDTIPFPADNPYTPAKALLGQMLFSDTRLSDAGELACASCHNPAFDYGDGLAKSIGHGMRPLARRASSVINSAWGQLFMWDGRAATLEEQVRGPVESSSEMNQSLDRVTRILSEIDTYELAFSVAFPHQAITPITVAKAIATYERTLVSALAPFDAWIDGDESSISDSAKRGFDLFNSKARCALCHTGWLLTDDGFHDTGLPGDDIGRGQFFPSTIKLQHAFKTPSLRDTALRGPYMHDGSLPTLEAVVAQYDQGGLHRPSQSELIEPLGLSPEEQRDIVAFLRTLTSPVRSTFVPVLPR
jgi:cytochrome c peroxidase